MRLSRPRSVPPAPGAGPAFVQSKAADSGVSQVASLDITLDSAATAGHLIVVGGCSDATLTGFSGSTQGASAINAQGLYLWWKIATGGETTLTVTPSVSRPVALAAAVYSGIVASPADQSATANSAGSSTTGPVSAGSTPSTTQASELVVAVTGPHSFPDSAAPNSPTWTGGYTGRAAAASTFATSVQNSACFIADLVVSSTGAQTTSTSWTNSAFDWGAVIVTFKAA